jgi:hypothetical protein
MYVVILKDVPFLQDIIGLSCLRQRNIPLLVASPDDPHFCAIKHHVLDSTQPSVPVGCISTSHFGSQHINKIKPLSGRTNDLSNKRQVLKRLGITDTCTGLS